jgi:hypothetical protein
MDQSEPKWLAVLRQACRESSQAAVARRLKVSPSAVNQVLKGTYKGSLQGLKDRVNGVMMGQTVDCPVFGDMPTNVCQDWQNKPKAFTNSIRSQMYDACRACPFSKIKQETKE